MALLWHHCKNPPFIALLAPFDKSDHIYTHSAQFLPQFREYEKVCRYNTKAVWEHSRKNIFYLGGTGRRGLILGRDNSGGF